MQVDLDSDGRSPPLDDAAICSLLEQHLGINNPDMHFKQMDEAARAPKGGTTVPASKRKGGAKTPSSVGQPSLDGFIALTRDLLEMEREAEVQQAQEFTLLRSPETAQARGTTLLNLRCEEVEGGLLGRSLLTLISNKGYTPTSGKGAPQGPLLPQHKFSPHDVVALRPNKGAAEGPPLVQGVVYRVRDTAVIVAVDDAPEEGLDQPLRLEKLANEVILLRSRLSVTWVYAFPV